MDANDLKKEVERLKDELKQSKKDKEEQKNAIKNFNETLLNEIKKFSSKEVYNLIKTQISSEYGQLTRLETTDKILLSLHNVITEHRAKQSAEIDELEEKLTSNEKTITELNKKQEEAEQINKEAESKINELSSELQQSLELSNTAQKNLRESKTRENNYKKIINEINQDEGKQTGLETNLEQLRRKLIEKSIQVNTLEEKLEEVSSNATILANDQSLKQPGVSLPGNSTNVLEMPYEKIGKIVTRLIPQFTGARTAELPCRVYEFLNACEMALKCIKPEEEEVLMSLLTTRLGGDAFELVRGNPIKTVKELEKLIKNTYLSARTLESVMTELKHSQQFMSEDIKSFSRRLQQLENKAKEIIKTSYNDNDSVALLKELHNSVITTFKIGLFDNALKQFMLSCTETELDKLLETALKITMLLSSQVNQYSQQNMLGQISGQIQLPTQSVYTSPLNYYHNPNQFSNLPHLANNELFNNNNSISSNNNILNNPAIGNNLLPNMSNIVGQNFAMPTQQLPKTVNRPNKPLCSFCNKPNHTYQDCRTRRQTPYCGNCTVYGHDTNNCPKATILATRTFNRKLKCKWCSRLGHEEPTCFSKQNYNKSNQGNERGASVNNQTVPQ